LRPTGSQLDPNSTVPVTRSVTTPKSRSSASNRVAAVDRLLREGEPVVLHTQSVKDPADQQRKEEVGDAQRLAHLQRTARVVRWHPGP
jgi:hypothetical protein